MWFGSYPTPGWAVVPVLVSVILVVLVTTCIGSGSNGTTLLVVLVFFSTPCTCIDINGINKTA
jgi:hypothetical protein